MCGFLVTHGWGGNDRFIHRRGPDALGVFNGEGFVFRHYLLALTGEPTPQPYVEGDVVCVYNGEIYNLAFTRSDGENLIPAYREHGPLFPAALEGEFAIALYDFGRDRAFFATDRFATKPLWRKGAECASYESGVGGEKVEANTIEVVEISTGTLLARHRYHDWDWRQESTDLDACIEAFKKAVERRYRPDCFIGLSSGYDSGALACALQGKPFKAYAVLASEDYFTLHARALLLPDVEWIKDFDIAAQERHLEEAEEFRYAIRYDHGYGRSSYKEDYAAKALSHICSRAVAEGRRVCLSGGGADEILSDYSLIPAQSEFKGRFPEMLKPWANFTASCQYSYLGKEECVGGSWGVETRYPYLDTAFVQSYLSLTPALKNSAYKAPLAAYLRREGFPFEENVKRGFCQ